MPRNPNTPCSKCGTLGWPTKGSETRTCRPCRALGHGDRKPYVRTKPYKHGYRTGTKTPCTDCGQPSWGMRCRACADIAQRGGDTPEQILERRRELGLRRRERDRQAPGLTATQRHRLRAKWIKQGKACVYCGAIATQVDHVIPLALGGTNREGNLAPACAPCNRAKCDNLVMEWRTGKRPRRMRWDVQYELKPKRQRKPKRLQVLHACPVCTTLVAGARIHCSPECMAEWNRRLARDRHRRRAGLPLDHTEPSGRFLSDAAA